jgi:hypothetical protein
MTDLVIGTIANANADLNVYFQNNTTGHTLTLPGTSDGSGLVTVDVSEQQFASNQSYDIWVTLASTNMNARLTITIGSSTMDCLSADFYKVKTENDTMDAINSFTISLI